jgi:hypothetical protein
MRHAGRDERLCCSAALLCRGRRRWVAVADAADRRDEMGLPGDSRWNSSATQHQPKVPGVPVAMHQRFAAWSGTLASDMCKKRRVLVAGSLEYLDVDPTWLAWEDL